MTRSRSSVARAGPNPGVVAASNTPAVPNRFAAHGEVSAIEIN